MSIEKIFIDTNVIIELLRGKRSVVSFFRSVEDDEIHGLTNKTVFLETVHVYLILKTDKGPLTLRKRPELIRNVDQEPVLRVFEIIDILPTDRIAKEYVVELIGEFGLLPNDALIAATCKHFEIKKIATFDEDFRRVDFLEVVEP